MIEPNLHDVFTKEYWGTNLETMAPGEPQRVAKTRHIFQAGRLCVEAGQAILAGHPGEELAEGTVLGGPAHESDIIQPGAIVLCDFEGIGPAHPTHRDIADKEDDETIAAWERRTMDPQDVDVSAAELFARNTQRGSGSKQNPTIVRPYEKSLYSPLNDTVYTRKINLVALIAAKSGQTIGLEIYKWGNRKCGIYSDYLTRKGGKVIDFMPPYKVGTSYDTEITDDSGPHVVRVRSAHLCLQGLLSKTK